MFLELANVCFTYQEEPVLQDISLSAAKGDFLGIIGPNGSGKSTLLKIMARILTAPSGTVSIAAKDIFSYRIQDLAKIVATVPEEILFNFPFTVEELVLMGRAPHLSFLQPLAAVDHAKVKACMEKTSISHLANRRINELSSGERQRVFIAQALAQEPDILLLDEPTAHLDINHQTEIFNVLKNLQQQHGLTIITVTHDLNLAALYCDNLALLKEGRIFSQGIPERVITVENIKDVYHTMVAVNHHPTADKLQITLLPKYKLNP